MLLRGNTSACRHASFLHGNNLAGDGMLLPVLTATSKAQRTLCTASPAPKSIYNYQSCTCRNGDQDLPVSLYWPYKNLPPDGKVLTHVVQPQKNETLYIATNLQLCNRTSATSRCDCRLGQRERSYAILMKDHVRYDFSLGFGSLSSFSRRANHTASYTK